MLTEEQQLRRPWNIKSDVTSDIKLVAWPPKSVTSHKGSDFRNGNDNAIYAVQNTDRYASPATAKFGPPVPPKPSAREIDYGNSGEEEMAAPLEAFSSNELVGDRPLIAKPEPPPGLVLRPLKKDSPFTQHENAVVDSQPVFKRATPVRMLGDMVWPPKGAAGVSGNTPSGNTQSPGPVRRQQKDYRSFFQQHQLPPNFPMYRAPPGTQHFGLEEGENATPM